MFVDIFAIFVSVTGRDLSVLHSNASGVAPDFIHLAVSSVSVSYFILQQRSGKLLHKHLRPTSSI